MQYMNSQTNITLEDISNVTAIVSLGSNLVSEAGNPVEVIKLAAAEVALLSIRPPLLSTFYCTDPVNCTSGTLPFINAVEIVYPKPGTTPSQLLQELHRIEIAFGRKRGGFANESRSLDLDLICFGNLQVNKPKLKLPHPRAHQRRFVLQPIADLAPGLVLPGQTVTVQELLGKLTTGQTVVPISTR